MKLSIVTTLYRSSSNLEEFYHRATLAARQSVADEYEIILVNDGSPDNSLEIAVSLSESDSHVIVVDLSRNFGHHKAMMTGLSHASGDRVFLIDSDLEEEPEWLENFESQMHSDECDVVYGVQEDRKGGFSERWSGAFFYRVFRVLSGLELPDNVVVARLMSRRYVDSLLLHGESEVFMAGLWVITGFNQVPYVIKKHNTSETTYTLRKKISQFVNAVTSFSSKPLVGIFFIGSTIFIISALYTAILIVNWLFFERPPGGYTSLIVSVWLLGGMISAFIGVVGIYISKIYIETKQRPYTIIRRIYRSDHDVRN